MPQSRFNQSQEFIKQFLDKPIATYTLTANKEVAVSIADADTDTFTSVAHGLANTNIVFPILNTGTAVTFPLSVYAGGLVQGAYYVVNKTDDTFQLSLTSGGAPIDITANATVDLTKWHFERCTTGSIVIANLPPALKYKGVVRFRTGYNPSFYMYPNDKPQVFGSSGAGLTGPLILSGQNGGVGGNFTFEFDHTFGAVYKFEGTAVSVNNSDAGKLIVNSMNTIWRGNIAPINITTITLAPQLPVFANGTTVEVYRA